jgi:hypothetical protein
MYLLRVREIGNTLYKAWSDATFDVIEAEAGQLGAPTVMTSFLAAAPPVPSTSDAGAFVDSLFAPAVSGVILCRADLGRCAAVNGLTVRMADRRHTLKLHLTENTAGVCTWLHNEITRQAENLRQLPNALASTRDHWLRRADASAAAVHEFQLRYSRAGQAVKLV